MAQKPNLVSDFDGVINSYKSGWKGPADIPDEPVPGVKEAFDILKNHFNIVIFSVRAETEQGKKGIKEYMAKYKIHYDSIENIKPVGLIIDDNCICFKGNWKESLKEISTFENWLYHDKHKKNK